MARLAGFEPATYGLEVRCSIQLSYRRFTVSGRLISQDDGDVNNYSLIQFAQYWWCLS